MCVWPWRNLGFFGLGQSWLIVEAFGACILVDSWLSDTNGSYSHSGYSHRGSIQQTLRRLGQVETKSGFILLSVSKAFGDQC